MSANLRNQAVRGPLSFLCIALMLFSGTALFAQDPAPPQAPPQAGPPQAAPPQAGPLMSPAQLENLVAPIALYPDPLLSQVLAASTYPLELVEAEQFVQQNSNLHGAQLMDAAKQQNWDPSVQALVAFPDALATLTRDVQWTTDLGNAFLAQQKDVMGAVQRMRMRAMQNGKLRSTPQQNVNTQTQDGQSAVVIQPADPQVVYVPVYNPVYVWGPPAWGYYPPLWYPGIGFGFGFGPGIYLGGFFPGWGFGWPGWGLGWGWGFGWFGGGLFVNGGFFGHYGFGPGIYGARFAGQMAWQHDPMHRAGVAYANRSVAARYNNARFAAGRSAAGMSANARAAGAGGWRSVGAGSSAARGSAPSSRAGAGYSSSGASRGYSNSGAASRGYSNAGESRGYSNPGATSRGYSNAGESRGYSNPGATSRGYSNSGASQGSSNGSRGSSAPRSAGGGSSGRSSGGGGGHSGGRR